jgi:hypothetical protein
MVNSPTNSSILSLTTRLLFVQVIKFSTPCDCFPEVHTRLPNLRIHLHKFRVSDIHYRNMMHLEKVVDKKQESFIQIGKW